VEEENKTYYSACLFSAVFALHDIGIMHRFINPGSIYINTKRIPKLTDLRYAKKMDGQKAYTVCGDPLYFAPEMVKQQGYDYGVDMWALGCVVYELFEGMSPMGSPDIEETQLFKKISAFEVDKLEFTPLSHKKVRSVITSLLEPDCIRRCGYKTQEDLKQKKMFVKMDFSSVGNDSTEFPFELLSHVDDSFPMPPEETLENCNNENFDAF
jgi:serine/threonine protein kinase